GFWLAFVFTVLPMFTITAGKVTTAGNSLVGMLGADAATGVGVFLLGWTIFTLYMFVGTFRLNGALIAVFFFLLLTFVALTAGWLMGGSTGNSLMWIQIGGWLGIITSLLAWYTGAAFVLADVNSSVKLPLFPVS